MIGSRLLFSAYGRLGPWGRALEAGLLGQDCLVVVDEAHLSSPFAATLVALEAHNRRSQQLAPFVVVRMGATMEPVEDLLKRTPGLVDEPRARRVFRLLEADTNIDGRTWPREIDEKNVGARLTARKRIEVESLDAERGAGVQLAVWALEKSQTDAGSVIGIILNTVAEVRRCVAELRKRRVTEEGLVVLTGSMRGLDRDAVVASAKYAQLKSQRNRSSTPAASIFLVATSCVEVGADIDCDHLGVEACPADSLIQRLGRVNRLGMSSYKSTVRIVGDPQRTDSAARVFRRTQELLEERRELHGSPASFSACLTAGLDEAEVHALFDVRVPPPALTPAVLDDFAMTSRYPDPGARPDVGRWLHGSLEDSSLYVELAWRDELDRVTTPEDAKRLIAAFPIGARETARCPLHEAVELLKAIRKRGVEDEALGGRVLLITRYGTSKGYCVRDLPADNDSQLRALIYDATVVLPASVGGYDGQFVDPKSEEPVKDIAEEAQPSSRAQRCRLWIDHGQVTTASGASAPQYIEPDTDADELQAEVEHVADDLLGPGWRVLEAVGDGKRGVVVARQDRRALEEAEDDEAALGFRKDVMLKDHLRDARAKAEEFCKRLSLPDELRETVIEAAGRHDLGKDRPWWQRAVGRVERPPVAKSRQAQFDHKINRGYRHELGSVADLVGDHFPNPIDRELCLHLVAAHHGHARPGFHPEAAGPILTDGVERVLTETPIRFAKLQAKYGWWGLAWLEALVKAADVLASRAEEDAS